MRRLAPFAIAPALLIAAACSPETPVGEPQDAPPVPTEELGGVDLNGGVNALGTEPFWGVEITPDQLVYAGVDRPEQVAPNPGVQMQGTMAIWSTETDQGAPLTVQLMATECSDGMSDRTYPLTARVEISGEVLNGCAASRDFIHNTDERGEPRQEG